MPKREGVLISEEEIERIVRQVERSRTDLGATKVARRVEDRLRRARSRSLLKAEDEAKALEELRMRLTRLREEAEERGRRTPFSLSLIVLLLVLALILIPSIPFLSVQLRFLAKGGPSEPPSVPELLGAADNLLIAPTLPESLPIAWNVGAAKIPTARRDHAVHLTQTPVPGQKDLVRLRVSGSLFPLANRLRPGDPLIILFQGRSFSYVVEAIGRQPKATTSLVVEISWPPPLPVVKLFVSAKAAKTNGPARRPDVSLPPLP